MLGGDRIMKHTEIDLSDHNRIFQEFKTESDRGAAVLTGSLIEHYLAKFIKNNMIDDEGLDKLFKGFGPLSSFNNRIECAFAFGFITLQQKNTLNFIRKVRNHFAHTPSEANFNKQPVSDWCECISKEKILPPGAIENIKSFSTLSNRDIFMLSISVMIAEWETMMEKKQQNA